jgi:hypothetical protein
LGSRPRQRSGNKAQARERAGGNPEAVAHHPVAVAGQVAKAAFDMVIVIIIGQAGAESMAVSRPGRAAGAISVLKDLKMYAGLRTA